MPATTHAADALSQQLVDNAIAHLDAVLADEKWLRNNRQLGTADRTFAFWVIPGEGMLTDSEKERVKQAYADKGWRNIIFFGYGHSDEANWSVEFQAMP